MSGVRVTKKATFRQKAVSVEAERLVRMGGEVIGLWRVKFPDGRVQYIQDSIFKAEFEPLNEAACEAWDGKE